MSSTRNVAQQQRAALWTGSARTRRRRPSLLNLLTLQHWPRAGLKRHSAKHGVPSILRIGSTNVPGGITRALLARRAAVRPSLLVVLLVLGCHNHVLTQASRLRWKPFVRGSTTSRRIAGKASHSRIVDYSDMVVSNQEFLSQQLPRPRTERALHSSNLIHSCTVAPPRSKHKLD